MGHWNVAPGAVARTGISPNITVLAGSSLPDSFYITIPNGLVESGCNSMSVTVIPITGSHIQ